MRPFPLALLLLPLACSEPAEPSAEPKLAAPAAAPPAATGPQSSGQSDPAVKASAVSEDTDLYHFDFAYPATAARLPGLRALLDRQREQARRELVDTATTTRRDLAADGIEYQPHSYAASWQTVADLPGWLSLSARISTYQGGAHPNHGFDSLLWDKSAGVRRDPIDVFAPPAFRQAVRQRFCAELDRQRAAKRQGEGIGDRDDPFNACIDPIDETVLILGSSNRRTFDRIGLLVAPYAAGPYAEGDYEVTLPVDRALLAAVRPEFRAAFSPAR